MPVPDIGPSSAHNQPSNPSDLRSRAADAVPSGGFALAGPSQRLDPATHAFRKDLADAALVGRVIASHYAEPLARRVAVETMLLERRDDHAASIATLHPGEPFEMLDCSLGWAWGYGGAERRVGYVRADCLKS